MIHTIIVDDELLAGVGIQSLIDGKEDVQVSGVFSGPEEAITYLREHTADIVITDIEMAGMNGLDFIQVIRERHLADGVIILSCHDDFSYAQEAISKGTDSYLLKHCISQEKLLEEIKKVYHKTHQDRAVDTILAGAWEKRQEMSGEGLYVIGVLRILTESGLNVDGTMLVNLLDHVVTRYQMGTFFAPYNREIFIIFQFAPQSAPCEVQQAIKDDLETISANIRQYLNCCILYGISDAFMDLKQTHAKYDEAVAALGMRFYRPEQTVFYHQEPLFAPPFPSFTSKAFLEADGVERFEEELSGYLQCAFLHRLGASALKGCLARAVGRMIDQILHRYHFSDDLVRRWSRETELTDVLSRADDRKQLQEQLTGKLGQLHSQCCAELHEDALSDALSHIETHLADKLSLEELAGIACMSVPSFSKKFKERTGMTLVQYLNVRRIERAKALLRSQSGTLECIAEETGFSNANYLIRVFKKVTGQTISEYRK